MENNNQENNENIQEQNSLKKQQSDLDQNAQDIPNEDHDIEKSVNQSIVIHGNKTKEIDEENKQNQQEKQKNQQNKNEEKQQNLQNTDENQQKKSVENVENVQKEKKQNENDNQEKEEEDNENEILQQKLQSQQSSDFQQAEEFNKEKGENHIQHINTTVPYRVVVQDDIPFIKEETKISSRNKKKSEGKYDVNNSSLFGNTKEDRVKDVMNHVQEWINYVENFLNEHQKNCEGVLLQLNKRSRQSLNTMNQIQEFFKDRQQKELNYANSLVHNKVPKLKGSYLDIEGKQSLIQTLNKTFEYADKIGLAQSQKVLEFSNYIQKQILDDLLKNEKKEYSKVFEEFSERIQALKQIQYKFKQEFEKVKFKFMKIVNIKLKPTKKDEKRDNDLKKKKDLHNRQTKFQKIFIQLIDSQTNLGQHLTIFWEELQRLECNRFEVIQQSFQLFVSQSIKVYGKNQVQDEFIQLVTGFNTFEEGQRAYNIENILTIKIISSIKNHLKIKETEKLKFENLNEYFYKFKPLESVKPDHPNNNRLIIESWDVQKDTGTIGVNWQPISIKVSADDFILFFDNDKEIQKSQIKGKKENESSTNKKIVLDNIRCYEKMHCSWLTFSTRKKDPYGLQLYIVEVQPGLLFNSKKKQLVKFYNKDDLEMFLEFMKIKYDKSVEQQQ